MHLTLTKFVRVLLCTSASQLQFFKQIRGVEAPGSSGIHLSNGQLIIRGMKLTALIMLIFCLQVSAKVTSQTVTFSGKKVPLETVFAEIKKQTGFLVVFNYDLIKRSKPVDVEAEKMPLNELLSTVLHGQYLDFKINKLNIVISKTKPAALVTATNNEISAEQQLLFTISGTVKGANGEPLAGATVRVKGKNIQTMTDKNGLFELVANAGDWLIVSFVGYESKEIKFDGNNDITISLVRKQSALEDVEIISDGYSKLPKERATGSFSSVSSKQLDKQIGALSISDKLQAFVPGILVTNNDGIIIRGKSTINANKSPIIVVDGFVTELSLSSINPNDVESITLLRDAAAASIWGVRASNGVIVITTKSGGKESGTRFNVSSNIRIESKPDIGSLKLANAAQYIDAELEALNKGWYNLTNPNNNTGYSRVYEIFVQRHNGNITETEAESRYNALRNNSSHAQSDLFFKNGINQQYNISAEGRSGINQYYMSVNYQDNKYTSRQNSDQRLKIMLKNSFQFTPALRLDAIVSAAYNKNINNGISLYELAEQKPYELIVDAAGNYVPRYETTRSIERNEQLENQGYYNWNRNLKQDFDNKDNTSNALSPRINLGLHYKLPAGLSFESKFVYERNNFRSDVFENEQMYITRDAVNRFTILNGTTIVNQLPRGTIYNAGVQNMQYTSFRNQLNFDYAKRDQHRINAILGTEVNKTMTNSRYDRYHNYSKEKLTHSIIDEAKLAAGVRSWNGGMLNYTPLFQPFREDENRFFSVYFNGSYTYNDKYTFSASGRIDQSNLLGATANERITPLYSMGVSYHLSRENWFTSSIIDNLVIRATTGVNGNIDKKTSKVLTAIPGKNTFTTTDDYLRIQYPENKGLKWESTRILNVGVDMALLNRITVGLDAYIKKSYDLLGYVDTDPTVGFTNVYKNTAKVENKGLDLRIAARILTGAFGWEANLNFSYSTNKITSVYNANPTVDNYLIGGAGREIEGRPIDYLFNYRSAGLSAAGEPQVYDDKGAIVSWMDNSAVPAISWLQYGGTTVPRYFGSFVQTFRYKGFSLTPVFIYQLGHVMRLPTPYIQANGSLLADIDRRWRKPGDEDNTYVPAFPANPNNSNFKRTDFYKNTDLRTQSASFVRLDNVSLTYDLPPVLFKKVITGIQLQAQASNSWLWHKNTADIDPQSIDLRFGSLGLARPAMYTFGVSVNFK